MMQLLFAFAIVTAFLVVVGSLATWTVYGLAPWKPLLGWSWFRCGSLIYVQPRWRIGMWPVAVYWWGGEDYQSIMLSKAMCRQRQMIDFNDDAIQCSSQLQTEAVKAEMSGRAIWPNEQCAKACGDKNGWWPEVQA